MAGVDEDSAHRAQEQGTAVGAAPAENGADPERGRSMVDRVLAHGFAGAEEVSPSESVSANPSSGPRPGPLPEREGAVSCCPQPSPPNSQTGSEQSDGIGDGAKVGSSAAVQVADGENAARCEAGSEAVELGVKPQSDTNEANFHGDVINSQTPENLGVTAELEVGAALDSVGGMHVVSPDLVCPNSERESSEAGISGAGELEAGAVSLNDGAAAGVEDGAAQAGAFIESMVVAREVVNVSQAAGVDPGNHCHVRGGHGSRRFGCQASK